MFTLDLYLLTSACMDGGGSETDIRYINISNAITLHLRWQMLKKCFQLGFQIMFYFTIKKQTKLQAKKKKDLLSYRSKKSSTLNQTWTAATSTSISVTLQNQLSDTHKNFTLRFAVLSILGKKKNMLVPARVLYAAHDLFVPCVYAIHPIAFAIFLQKKKSIYIMFINLVVVLQGNLFCRLQTIKVCTDVWANQ